MSDQQRQRRWMQRLAQPSPVVPPAPPVPSAPPVEEDDADWPDAYQRSGAPMFEMYQTGTAQEEAEDDAAFDRVCARDAAKTAEANALTAGCTPAAAKTAYDAALAGWHASSVVRATKTADEGAFNAAIRAAPAAYDAAIAVGADPRAAYAAAAVAGGKAFAAAVKPTAAAAAAEAAFASSIATLSSAPKP